MSNVGSFDISKFNNNNNAIAAFESAPSTDTSRSKVLDISGSYIMEVSTFCFRNKNNKIIASPQLAVSSKGGINLVAILRVVEGTSLVSVGDYITVNIPVWPGPKATYNEIENMFRMSKPRICALLGDDNFKISPEAIVQKFTAEWKEENGKFILVKDHSLKQRVFCVFEDHEYNNKPSLKLVTLRKIQEGDKSVSNSSSDDVSQIGFGSAARPAQNENMNFNVISEIDGKNDNIEPELSQQDELPF